MAEGYCNSSSKSKAALLQTTNDKLWELTFIPLEALEKDVLLKRPSVQKTCLNSVEKKSQKYSLQSLPYYLS